MVNRRACAAIFFIGDDSTLDVDCPPPFWDTRFADYGIGQWEITPTTGLYHFQCWVYSKGGIRFTALSAILKEHSFQTKWAYCRGTMADNDKYVTKLSDCIGGPYEFGRRPDSDGGPEGAELWDTWAAAAKEGRFDDIPHKVRASHMKYFDRLRKEETERICREKFIEACPEQLTFRWQEVLLEKLLAEPNNRTIIYVFDAVGGGGKTQFCKYMIGKYFADTQVMAPGKGADLAYALQTGKKYYLIDIPRVTGEHMAWGFIEQLKNGMIFSPKYESGFILQPASHVVIFSNQMLEPGKFSEDRLDFIDLATFS